MKSIIIALLLLVACSTMSFAQCDKKITLSSSKTEHLDGSGVSQNTEDERVVIDITKSDITVLAENGNHKMTGKIKSLNCNWKVPFKEGKTVLSTTLNDDSGDDGKDFTITIEGKDGKVTLLAESPQMPDRKIKLALEKFEEKN